MEADEKTRKRILSTGRTVMAFAMAGPVIGAALLALYASSMRPEGKGEHFVLWLVLEWLADVGLCVLAWLVGRGLTRSREWARKVALWACIVLACYVLGFWIAIVVRYWLRDPILALVGGAVTAVPVAIFAYVLYACIRWLRSPAVVSVFEEGMRTREEGETRAGS